MQTQAPARSPRGSRVVRSGLHQALIVAVTFVVAGAACGWLWHQWWQPAPQGFVVDGQAHFADDAVFRGTGLYFLIASVAGLVIGALVTRFFEKDEVWTLAGLVVGALLAGAVMLLVGRALGPDSAAEFAESAKNFEAVTGDLSAAPLAVVVAFPGGALVGAVTMLSLFSRRIEPEPSG